MQRRHVKVDLVRLARLVAQDDVAHARAHRAELVVGQPLEVANQLDRLAAVALRELLVLLDLLERVGHAPSRVRGIGGLQLARWGDDHSVSCYWCPGRPGETGAAGIKSVASTA